MVQEIELDAETFKKKLLLIWQDKESVIMGGDIPIKSSYNC